MIDQQYSLEPGVTGLEWRSAFVISTEHFLTGERRCDEKSLLHVTIDKDR